MCLKDALKKLSPMISESRKALIASVVTTRSNSLSILLENVHNEANENAILRSMDALGCCNLHKLTTTSKPRITRKKLRYPPRTDAGARTWVSIHQWYNTLECASHLKNCCGYTLAIACPTAQTSLSNVDFSQKLLVAFGNETSGISEELAELSDIKFSIPMSGFVESYNVSVSVALILYHAYLQRVSNDYSYTQYSNTSLNS